MDAEKVHSYLQSLARINEQIRGADNHATVTELAGLCGDHIDGLAAELDLPETPQRFEPLLYSLRSIYSQLATTRAMVDVPTLADWSDAVLARIIREVAEPAAAAESAPPSIPEGAKELVIFESFARPGFRVACFHMGIGNELFGLDQKPRVPPDPTKWHVVAYYELPAGRDLIPATVLALPGDEGLPDWKTAELAPAPAAAEVEQPAPPSAEARGMKLEGHAPTLELVPNAPAAEAAPGESAPGESAG
jgi:hypothetical protein